MLFKRRSNDRKVKVNVYINYGHSNKNNSIKKSDMTVHSGASVLEILRQVSDIQYTPDESATAHMGSMITAIDGWKNDLNHYWMYYLREEGECGWTLPMKTPDAVLITRDTLIAWRYHEVEVGGLGRSGNQIFGPFYSRECCSRIKKCNRQF